MVTITKKIALFFLLLLLIGLSACGNNSEEPIALESDNSISMPVETSPQEEVSEESIHDDINDSIDESSIEEESALLEQDVQIFEDIINGTFKALPNARYSDGFEPYIELYEDNSCIFVVNYFEGMCTTKGVYSVNGNRIAVELMSSEPDGFLGGDGAISYMAYNHIFIIIDNDTLKINDEVYATPKYELFVRE